MIRKALLVLTLGVAGTTGIALAHQGPSQAHRAYAGVVARHSVASEVAISDPDAAAPCVTTAGGDQTGNCSDASYSGGAQDSQPEAVTSEGEAAGPDGDNIQSGANLQSGSQ